MPKAGHGKQEEQQSVELLDPDDTVFLPAAQDVQTVSPCDVEYVPAAQAKHEADATLLAILPAGHEIQRFSETIIKPTAVENFPRSQE